MLVGLGLCVVILAGLAGPGRDFFPVAFADKKEGEEPPYPHGEFEADCAMCHGAEGWVPAVISESFDHAEYGFRLDGAHRSTPCQSCHVSLEFNQADSTCVACHQDIHRGELGNDCSMCHTTRNFIDRPGVVRAHRMTRFPLTGAHATVDCDACHIMARGGQSYVNTPIECESCHLDNFMATTEPNHVQASFDKNCEMCHSVFTWLGAGLAGFNHSATGFPLTGAHIGAPCTNCHTSGSFGIIPSDCNSCHSQDYQLAPGHVSGNFSLQCDDCHSTQTWGGAAVNHDFFPLTGGHNFVSCFQCHTNGTTGPIPADCFSCHQADYQTALDHVALDFPIDCESCHNISNWQNVNFDHLPFKISSGPHSKPCLDCHTQGTTSTFSCLGACHEHKEPQMDDKHSDVPGYAYEFNLCFACHPTGQN